jgi:LmbE family N-acetylglucosaminyl deacetylase
VFHFRQNRPRSILCIGAHADDIEIGCGGTILSLIHDVRELVVHWVVLSGEGDREAEARSSASLFLEGAGAARVITQRFRDSYFPAEYAGLKDFFVELRNECNPDWIFTHRLEDRHQDHRLAAELTWNAFRDHLILEYEIPKYEGDLAAPNFFVPFDEEIGQRKIDFVHKAFPSQHGKHWFHEETLRSLMRIRGLEARADSLCAEGFTARKLVV